MLFLLLFYVFTFLFTCIVFHSQGGRHPLHVRSTPTLQPRLRVVQNFPIGKHVLRTRVQLSSFVIWTTLNRLPVIVDVALIMEARLAWNALRGLYGAHYVLYRLQIRYQWTETELWNAHMPGVNRRTHGRWGTDISFREISRFYDSRLVSKVMSKFHYTDPRGPTPTRISEKLRWSVRVSDKVRASPVGSGLARVVEFSLKWTGHCAGYTGPRLSLR